MPRQTNRLLASLSSLPLLLVDACGDDGGIPDGPFMDPIGGTAGSEGGVEPDDGVDDTAGATPVEDTQCLFDPVDGLYGYRYQCEGSVALDIVIEHGFDDRPIIEFFELEFGHGVDGDTYEDPLVMACCPWYETGPGEHNCDQPHERACLIDLVEQGCKSLVPKIEHHAHVAFPGLLEGAKRQAVLRVADYVRTHQDDCTTAFRDETSLAITAPACDAEGNSQPFASMLEDGVWSFDPDGPVTNVEIAVAEATWTGLYPIYDDQAATRQCDSADYNDGVHFLEVDPSPSAEVLRLASGGARLDGPSTEGIGELGSTSRLALVTTVGAASLENLALHSAGTATVVVENVTIPVESFHVRLWDGAPAVADEGGETLTVEPGSARFAISASALGERRGRTATNATPIVITREGDGWRTSAFSIDHPLGNEVWSLVVESARWQ